MQMHRESENTEAQIVLNREWAANAFSHKLTSLPFSFVYGGRNSAEFMQDWTCEVRDEKIGDTIDRRTLILTDPATRLEVCAICLIYLDTPGVDWTVYFTNTGDKDTPVIEQVKAVDAVFPTGSDTSATLHRLNGSTCAADDWMPFVAAVAPVEAIDASPAE